MKKVVVILLLSGLLSVVLLVGVRTAVILHGDNVPIPGIWSGPNAIMASDHREADTSEAYDQLPDKSGFEIGSPLFDKGPWCAFTKWRRSLVYWSSRDRCICIVSPEQSIRWIPANRWLPSDSDVCSVYASEKSIYLNVRDRGGQLKVLRIAPTTGQITVLPRVVDVRAHDDSDRIIAVRSDGSVVISSGEGAALTTGLIIGAPDSWDADPVAGVVCWQLGRHLKVYNKGKITESDLGGCVCRGVSVCPLDRVIWVSVDLDLPPPIPWEAQARVFDYNGAYLGAKPFCGNPAEPPMLPYDPVVSQIAYKISRGTKNYY